MKAAKHITLLAALICSLNGVAGAVETGVEPPQRLVKFADLDLGRIAGVTVLYARLQSAAWTVCEPADARALESLLTMRRCVAQAIERAVAKVNAPSLTDYYLAKTGQVITVAQQR